MTPWRNLICFSLVLGSLAACSNPPVTTPLPQITPLATLGTAAPTHLRASPTGQTETVMPFTNTPGPTDTQPPTQLPSQTPAPSNTPRPTASPKPTNTPGPTNTPRPTATPKPLALNDTGERVKKLQQRLLELGYLGACLYDQRLVNSTFGETTDQAVKTFQAAHGLAVTGIVDPDTEARLQSQDAVRQAPPPIMPPPSVTIPRGKAGRLAIAYPTGDNTDIYLMDADLATMDYWLTKDPADDYSPSWSPDGGRIAFISTRSGHNEIYVMSADGSNPTRLTCTPANISIRKPVWSPDGNRLAFSSTLGGNLDIYAINLDGANLVNLTNSPAADWYPDWGRPGRLAFNSDRDGNLAIYTMNPDGSDVVRLTDPAAQNYYPAWSPDGSRLAFTSRRDGNSEIYVMQADGSNPTRITQTTNRGASLYLGVPEWSADGSLLAYQYTEQFGCGCGYIETFNELRVVKADGTVKLWDQYEYAYQQKDIRDVDWQP